MKNSMIESPTHLIAGPTARATACGLNHGSRPALPYTHARFKPIIDKARIDGALPLVDWCPVCVAHFDEVGWP